MLFLFLNIKEESGTTVAYWLRFKGFYTLVWGLIPRLCNFLQIIWFEAYWRFERSTVGRAVRCGRLLWRKPIHRICRPCRTVRRSKCFWESFIVESLSVELFINIAYVAGSWSSYLIELEIIRWCNVLPSVKKYIYI